MFKAKHSCIPIIALTLLAPSMSFAQSAMVETHNESAHDCYQSATSAATLDGFEVSATMLEPCNVALIELGLSDEDRGATFVNRGILYAASGLLGEALADYEEAISLYPTLSQVYINRAFVYHFENQLDQALNDYSRALELDIQSKHLAYFARGIVYEEKQLWQEAISDYRKALEHNPDWAPAKARLQWVVGKLTISTQTYEFASNQ